MEGFSTFVFSSTAPNTVIEGTDGRRKRKRRQSGTPATSASQSSTGEHARVSGDNASGSSDTGSGSAAVHSEESPKVVPARKRGRPPKQPEAGGTVVQFGKFVSLSTYHEIELWNFILITLLDLFIDCPGKDQLVNYTPQQPWLVNHQWQQQLQVRVLCRRIPAILDQNCRLQQLCRLDHRRVCVQNQLRTRRMAAQSQTHLCGGCRRQIWSFPTTLSYLRAARNQMERHRPTAVVLEKWMGVGKMMGARTTPR